MTVSGHFLGQERACSGGREACLPPDCTAADPPDRTCARRAAAPRRHDGVVSKTVDLADLPAEIAARGPAAFLMTVGTERTHVVSVSVAATDGHLEVGAGRTTARNVAERPGITLLWPFDATHPGFSLIVDGTATLSADEDQLAIEPTGAILHRAGGRAPGC